MWLVQAAPPSPCSNKGARAAQRAVASGLHVAARWCTGASGRQPGARTAVPRPLTANVWGQASAGERLWRYAAGSTGRHKTVRRAQIGSVSATLGRGSCTGAPPTPFKSHWWCTSVAGAENRTLPAGW
eukprot:CAMPEP_0182548424 /NCGR_PEP_ID=MMETSP1323-20130603/38806_1 /TAXON_ID=236787 /ORGANISM="Florenciella parvula, Strain RCC1693" /LENGTH=127 /DNA_ID=CAMNT_0024759817 /DNA_START=70 /DNA_END=453 /DNA_ORIENTATION=-